MVLACRQETREYMDFGVPSVWLTLAKKSGLAKLEALYRGVHQWPWHSMAET